MTFQALPHVVLLGFLFGSTLIASRFSVGQFEPSTYIGLRLVLASLCHLTIYGLSRQRSLPTGRRLLEHGAVMGVFATAIPMTSIVTSLQFQSSGVTSALITTSPAITVVMAHFFLPEEKLSWRKSFGVGLAFAGALTLVLWGGSGLPDVSEASPIGYGLVFLAMLSASVSTIFARKYMRNYDTFDVASVRMIVAALVVMPLSLLVVGFDVSAVTAEGYVALGYAALVGTFSGLMLAFYIIQKFGATASAMTAYVIPVFATLGGVLLLGETVTTGILVGMSLIIAGIAIINLQQRRVESEMTSAAP